MGSTFKGLDSIPQAEGSTSGRSYSIKNIAFEQHVHHLINLVLYTVLILVNAVQSFKNISYCSNVKKILAIKI